jgi:hypothetical protein
MRARGPQVRVALPAQGGLDHRWRLKHLLTTPAVARKPHVEVAAGGAAVEVGTWSIKWDTP